MVSLEKMFITKPCIRYNSREIFPYFSKILFPTLIFNNNKIKNIEKKLHAKILLIINELSKLTL